MLKHTNHRHLHQHRIIQHMEDDYEYIQHMEDEYEYIQHMEDDYEYIQHMEDDYEAPSSGFYRNFN